MDTNQIHCPNCGTAIDVQDILTHKLEEDIKKRYNQQLVAEQKRFEEMQSRLQLEKEEFDKKKRVENELFQERMEKQLKEEKRVMEEKLKSKLREEQAEQFQTLLKRR
jgi:hypothetical protein